MINILFVHQNFPGQFVHLFHYLKENPRYRIKVFCMNQFFSPPGDDIDVIRYFPTKSNGKDTHEWLIETESKVIRGEAALNAAINLRNREAYTPDIIYAHPGWGESLFLKQVWPTSKLIIYSEFYYKTIGADVGFDPEFSNNSVQDSCNVQLKNFNTLMNLEVADYAISPTLWQKQSFPIVYQDKIEVIHEGVDCLKLDKFKRTGICIGNKPISDCELVLTFVNRTFEPYRGYHVFMRALPSIMMAYPNCKVLLIGSEGTSYGPKPIGKKSWKQIFFDEIKDKVDTSRIHFLGPLDYDTYCKVLKHSDVHVYLTYPFVLSWSLIEAMALGCSIVASNTKPVIEVIEDGINGLLVDFFDHRKLADAVCALFENPMLRNKLSKNAKRKAFAEYDLRSVAIPKILNFLKRVED